MSSFAGNFCINHPAVKTNLYNSESNVPICKKCENEFKKNTHLFADNNVLDFNKLPMLQKRFWPSCNVDLLCLV